MNDHHRILLVDDEPLLLATLRRHIERICPEATVVYALNPQSAVWQLENTSVAMVFTDMRMGGVDDAGWIVGDAADRASVPVVVLTGDVEAAVARAPRSRREVDMRRKDSIGREHIAALLQPALKLASNA
jgi:DNA-binding NtrC family response regulator